MTKTQMFDLQDLADITVVIEKLNEIDRDTQDISLMPMIPIVDSSGNCIGYARYDAPAATYRFEVRSNA